MLGVLVRIGPAYAGGRKIDERSNRQLSAGAPFAPIGRRERVGEGKHQGAHVQLAEVVGRKLFLD